MNPNSDQWTAGATYEEFMGRWSRELAGEFVNWLGCAPQLNWLDVGCGTGSLTRAICAKANPASVVACDPSPAFVDYARTQLNDSRVTFVVASCDDFPAHPAGYGAITSLLALNFFPSPQAALTRMCASAAKGSQLSACVWDYAGEMQFLRCFWDSAVRVIPAARDADEAVRFPICNPKALEELFSAAGLEGVTCEPLEITTRFPGFPDYWRPFLAGIGPAPAFVASLSLEEQEALKAELEGALPTDADGTMTLRARAWAVRGVTPSA
jgi:trans-aconitate methyltransferase